MSAPAIRLSDAARKALQEAARAAGIESIHTHSLRHTAASLALTRGVPLYEVRG